MAQEHVHARVSQPGSDATGQTELDADIDQAVTDAAERARADSLVEHSDELLEEIDAILTEEETFAVNYLQKGGQ
jgi:hypothetical protein